MKIKLDTCIFSRWLRLLAKSNEIPDNTNESKDVKGWMNACADRMEELETINCQLLDFLEDRIVGQGADIPAGIAHKADELLTKYRPSSTSTK